MSLVAETCCCKHGNLLYELDACFQSAGMAALSFLGKEGSMTISALSVSG